MNFAESPEPPWQRCPGAPPWWGGWRQGNEEPWYVWVFLPFWRRLCAEDQRQYLERWPPPDPDWARYLAEFAAHPLPPARDFSGAPQPPWREFPGRGPRWIGWHFGAPRRWLRAKFVPFWQGLPELESYDYLERWPPPSPAWVDRLFCSWR